MFILIWSVLAKNLDVIGISLGKCSQPVTICVNYPLGSRRLETALHAVPRVASLIVRIGPGATQVE